MTDAVPVKIICIGNALLEGDDAGARVYAQLTRAELPQGVGLIDGGLGGLRLLPLIDGCRQVIFVDTVTGFAPPGAVLALPAAALSDVTPGAAFGHDQGLAYLLAMLPAVCEHPPGDVVVVGLERPARGGAEAHSVARAADLCLALTGGPAVVGVVDAGISP